MGNWKFFRDFSIFAILLGAMAYGLSLLLQPVAVLSPNFWLFFGYLYVLTGIVFVLSIFGVKKGPEIGVFSLLGGIVIKLLFSLALFLVIWLKSAENQIVLGLNFFCIYLLFTSFEVIYLLRKLRHQN